MNIFEIILYVLSFTVFYFIIGKAFRKVDEIKILLMEMR